MKANVMNKVGIKEFSKKEDPFYFHGIYLTFIRGEQSLKNFIGKTAQGPSVDRGTWSLGMIMTYN